MRCSWPSHPRRFRSDHPVKRQPQHINTKSCRAIGITEEATTRRYPHLKEHADDGHHRKPSVSQLRRKLFRLLSRVAGSQDLEAEVARCGWGAGRLVLGNLAEGHVGKDLSPSCGRHLRDSCQAVGHISEFQAR